VSRAAALALGHSRQAEAVEPLLRYLAEPKECCGTRPTLCAAIESLGVLGDHRALQPIIRILETDTTYYNSEAAAAARALGDLQDQAALGPLIRAIGSAWSEVRRAAAKSLRRLGQPKWEQWIRGADEDFGRLGESGDPETIIALAHALSQKGLDRDDRCILSWWEGHSNLHETIAMCLARVEGSGPLRTLCNALVHRSGDVSSPGGNEPSDYRDSQIVESLAGELQAASGRRRALLAIALGQVGDTRAVEPLLESLRRSDAYLRWVALLTLGRLKDVTAADRILASLTSNDARVVVPACWALGEISDSRGVEALISVLHSHQSDRWIMANAAVALGKLRDHRASEPLISCLRHFRSQKREDSCMLHNQGAYRRAPDIRFDNSHSALLGSIVTASGEIGDRQAIPVLREMLADEDERLRARAREALEKLESGRQNTKGAE
jgi:HEAT repeat protein